MKAYSEISETLKKAQGRSWTTTPHSRLFHGFLAASQVLSALFCLCGAAEPRTHLFFGNAFSGCVTRDCPNRWGTGEARANQEGGTPEHHKPAMMIIRGRSYGKEVERRTTDCFYKRRTPEIRAGLFYGFDRPRSLSFCWCRAFVVI